MAKVICTLPNASHLINGIRFVEDAKGLVSEEIPDDVAAKLATIKGYRVVGAKAKKDDSSPPLPPAAPLAAPSDEKDDRGGDPKPAGDKPATT